MSLSPEIKEQRRGSITASTAHRMMTGWDTPRPKQPFPAEILGWIEAHQRKPKVGDIKNELDCAVSGDAINAAWSSYQFDKPSSGLMTYAEELACEELFERDPDEWDGQGSKAIQDGIEREEECVERLADATGLKFVKTGDDQIHISANGIGATPDGIVYNELDLIETGCEVKCRSALHHARQILIRDNASLIDHDFERFCQIQVQMLVSGASEWYSASFNPFAKLDAHKFHYCVIQRDKAFIEIVQQRAAAVFEHKDHFLRQIWGATEQVKAA